MRGKSRKYVIAGSALKRIQVDAWAFWFDADEHHPGFAPRTGGALKCNRWNGGRQALRLGHGCFPTNRRKLLKSAPSTRRVFRSASTGAASGSGWFSEQCLSGAAGRTGRASLAAHRCSHFLSRSRGIVLMTRTPGSRSCPSAYQRSTGPKGPQQGQTAASGRPMHGNENV
jgi:hypothetical protein